MAFEHYIANKKAFIFGLDDVIYPQKDYLLQVYYLFAEFMEYSEQINAKEVLLFMQQEFEAHGSTNIFEKTASKFNIPQKYKENFILLHQNARLPLKLLLYQNILSFLQEIVLERKTIFLLVDGNPLQQLNKIKQTEWHGLEQYLKVFFTEEFEPMPSQQVLKFILNQNDLNEREMMIVGATNKDEEYATSVGVDYIAVTKLL
jgi:phosphoglycolate phosphatase-like HAD superfamily hydrolase